MFFLEMEGWRKDMEALGIQKTIDYLQAKGLPAEWPTRVADPEDKYTFYLQKGKPWYKSACPCYEGYYLGGGAGAVKCAAAGELLPGVVWYGVCQIEYGKCPYFRKDENNEQKHLPPEGG